LHEKLDRAGSLVPRPVPAPADFITQHCHHPNPYVVTLALDAFARRHDPAGAREAAGLLGHPDPMVREAAVIALAAGDPSGAPALLDTLTHDPERAVARTAARALAQLAGRPIPEGPMYSTVEKILLLKSAPVFERVAGEDLAPLARIAEVEVYNPGQVITQEGAPGDALYILVRGRVSVSQGGRVLGTLGPGDTLGEMSTFDGAPRSATGTATEETEALRIGNEEFYEVLHEQVEIAEGVIRVLCGRIRNLDKELAAKPC
jgi:hypothetical protein